MAADQPNEPVKPDTGGDPALDAAIAAAQEAELEKKATSLFDLRKIIAGVMLVYGVVLLLVGIFGSEVDKKKAAGININLWVGIALLVVGALFVAWAMWRPLISEEEEQSGRGSGRLRRAPS
jgi:hypothetical protein